MFIYFSYPASPAHFCQATFLVHALFRLTPVPHCLRLKTIKDCLPISLNAFSCIQQKKHRSFSCPPSRNFFFPSYPFAACSIVMDAALFITSVAWKKHDSLTFFQVRLHALPLVHNYCLCCYVF